MFFGFTSGLEMAVRTFPIGHVTRSPVFGSARSVVRKTPIHEFAIRNYVTVFPNGASWNFHYILWLKYIMDSLLYKSSLINGMLILFILFYALYRKNLPKYIIAILLLVVITSLMNHGMSDEKVKWLDRIIAIVAIGALAYHINDKHDNNVLLVVMLALVCVFYLIAKFMKNNLNDRDYVYFHMMSHMFATFLIFWIIANPV
jgi:hypothetical protein